MFQAVEHQLSHFLSIQSTEHQNTEHHPLGRFHRYEWNDEHTFKFEQP